MTGARATFPRFRRLAVAVGAVCLCAAIGTPTAAAELGLPGLGDIDATATGVDVQLSDAAGPLSSAPPLAQATETLEHATAPTLTETTEPVAGTVTPLLEPARETQLLPATVETLGAVTESVVAPVAETLPVVEAVTRPLLQETLPTLSSTLESAARVSGTADVGAAPDLPSTVGASPAETAFATTGDGFSIATPASVAPLASSSRPSHKDELTVSTRRGPHARLADSDSDLPAIPSLPGAVESTTPVSGGAEGSPQSPGVPPPFAQGGPLSGLASASASAGAGAFVPLLAALAAALVLAVPGLSRRLRLRLAPWSHPILQLSLERPG